MGRIQKGYESKFRALLGQIKAGKLEQRVQRLLARARRLNAEEGISDAQALAQVSRRLQTQLDRWKNRTRRHSSSPPLGTALSTQSHFLCDAGLGGLARWLRGAGYQARWIAGIDDDELLREARRLGAILVTTDSGLMERRILRDGIIRAVWVPPCLTMVEQLEMVLRETGLPLREPRCMECGGELRRVDKEKFRERIPPRTYRWLDEYFACEDCGKLFWHGTHWQRIGAELQRIHVK